MRPLTSAFCAAALLRCVDAAEPSLRIYQVAAQSTAAPIEPSLAPPALLRSAPATPAAGHATRPTMAEAPHVDSEAATSQTFECVRTEDPSSPAIDPTMPRACPEECNVCADVCHVCWQHPTATFYSVCTSLSKECPKMPNRHRMECAQLLPFVALPWGGMHEVQPTDGETWFYNPDVVGSLPAPQTKVDVRRPIAETANGKNNEAVRGTEQHNRGNEAPNSPFGHATPGVLPGMEPNPSAAAGMEPNLSAANPGAAPGMEPSASSPMLEAAPFAKPKPSAAPVTQPKPPVVVEVKPSGVKASAASFVPLMESEPTTTLCPENCARFFDGCSICDCTSAGEATRCHSRVDDCDPSLAVGFCVRYADPRPETTTTTTPTPQQTHQDVPLKRNSGTCPGGCATVSNGCVECTCGAQGHLETCTYTGAGCTETTFCIEGVRKDVNHPPTPIMGAGANTGQLPSYNVAALQSVLSYLGDTALPVDDVLALASSRANMLRQSF